jgi:hypothetical protein
MARGWLGLVLAAAMLIPSHLLKYCFLQHLSLGSAEIISESLLA